MAVVPQSVKMDSARFNKSDLQETEKYLLRTLGTGIVPDAKDPDALEYMQFAFLLDAHLLAANRDRDIYLLWKKVYKAVAKSESRFQYHVYKGHLLIRMALSSLAVDADLDVFLDILRQAYGEDKAYYNNPDLRPAYKIMSFMQPIIMFRSELWPTAKELRRGVANRLVVVLSLSRSKWAIALSPDTLTRTIAACIPNDEDLLAVLKENVREMFSAAEAAEKEHIFAKSVMFLLGSIVEGVLLELATRSGAKEGGTRASSGEDGRSRHEIDPKLSRASIKQLAEGLRQCGVIDQKTEYHCRFIQHYRDFVHPMRNVKHQYKLDMNFHKMFILFSALLLEDLSKTLGVHP